MITIKRSRDGRTWYGRRLYQVRLDRPGYGYLLVQSMTSLDSRNMVARLIGRCIIDGHACEVIDETSQAREGKQS